jgi:hypothetical protein
MAMNNATTPVLGRPANQRSAIRPADPDRWVRHLGRIAASYQLARPGVHIREEENNIWTDVKDNFSDEQRIQMNVAFERAKARVRPR